MGFRHFTYSERCTIETLYKKGFNGRRIASILNRDFSAVYDELKRGRYIRRETDYTESISYSADIGQRFHDFNIKNHGNDIKLTKQMHDIIQFYILKKRYSVYAVVGVLRNKYKICISPQTLYHWIYAGYFSKLTRKHLIYNVKRNKHDPIRPSYNHVGRSIEMRPDLKQRSVFGHWEIDSVVGKRSGSGESILVLTERKTRIEIIEKLHDKTADSVLAALRSIRKNYKYDFLSITSDNGIEFSKPYEIEKIMGCPMYKCHAFCSGERGSNENNNKLIRRWLLKHESMQHITNEYCKKLEAWLNNYPRKLFDYASADDQLLELREA